MFKYTVVLLVLISYAAAKPGLLSSVTYTSPILAAAPGVVTASSSQVIARNYNGIAAAPILAPAPLAVAPVATSLAARYVASPLAAPLAYSAPLSIGSLGYASPLSYAAPALW